jgi:hypothetical protein
MTHPLISLLYLDPSSGSILLQLILASLLGIGVAVRIFWRKIRGVFNKSSQSTESDELDDQD